MMVDGRSSRISENQEQVFRNVCRPNCGGHCPVNVHVRNGKVVKITMAELPDPRYNRICHRGMTSMHRIYHPERIKYPMKRIGERGEGKWERISWDEAIDTISAKFKEIQQRYGKQAIMWSTLSGDVGAINGWMPGLTRRFFNAIGATSLIPVLDAAHHWGIARVIINGPGAGLASEMKELARAKTIFTWGLNMTESNIHNWHHVADALENGARLVVVDPCFTNLASKADMHVPVRPGSDPILSLSMAKVIIDENLHNRDFLSAHTVAPFLVRDDTKMFLRQSDITGIQPEKDAKDDYIVWEPEIGQPIAASSVNRPALEGRYTANGIAATTAFQLLKDFLTDYDPEKAAGLTDLNPNLIRELARLYATGTPTSSISGYGSGAYNNGGIAGHALATLMAITGQIGLPGAVFGTIYSIYPGINPKVWFPDGKMGTDIPSLILPDVIKTGEFLGKPFPIKALYITYSNLLHNHVNQNEFLEDILPALNFVVVTDLSMTDTARYADIVLPATHWYEAEDITLVGASSPFMAYCEKAIEPCYESKSNSEIYRLLAEKMGVGQYFAKTDREFMEEILNSDYSKMLGITLERLIKEKVIRYLPDNFVAWGDYNFKTPSGRVEFYLENPQPRMTTGLPYDKNRHRLPMFEPPREAWPDNPLAQKYPLVCINSRSRWRVHSQWSDVPLMLEMDGEPTILLNPLDAEQRGIKTGDWVKVFNDRGRVVLKAVTSERIKPGMVDIPKGWQRHQSKEGCYQELTASHLHADTVNQSFFDVLVEVQKA